MATLVTQPIDYKYQDQVHPIRVLGSYVHPRTERWYLTVEATDGACIFRRDQGCGYYSMHDYGRIDADDPNLVNTLEIHADTVQPSEAV